MIYKSILIFLFSFFLISASNSFGQCEKLKKKRIDQLLGAAQYDNAKSSDIIPFAGTYKEEYQINLFKDMVYKMVFDATKMPEGVVIKLVDLGKKRDANKYEEVFNSDSTEITPNGTYEVTMEFPQRKMMVIYEIGEETKPGCISFVLGYYFRNNIR